MDNLKWKAIYLSDPQKEKSSKSLIGRWRLDILEVPRDNSITIKEKLGFRIRVTYIWLTVVKIGYEHMLLVSVSFNFLHLFAPTCTLRLYSRHWLLLRKYSNITNMHTNTCKHAWGLGKWLSDLHITMTNLQYSWHWKNIYTYADFGL